MSDEQDQNQESPISVGNQGLLSKSSSLVKRGLALANMMSATIDSEVDSVSPIEKVDQTPTAIIDEKDNTLPLSPEQKKRLLQSALETWLTTPKKAVRNQALGTIIDEKERVFEFRTVTLNIKGQIIDECKGQGRYFTEDLGNGVTLDMVSLPSGTFWMGSPETEADREGIEGPQHKVTVPAFYMGKYQVTQAQWRAVVSLPKVDRDLEPDPPDALYGYDRLVKDDHPVKGICWEDAIEFCARLSKKTGKTYRLPSEAEWEYACRAGTLTPFAFGETITPKIVNYDGRYPYGSAPEGEDRSGTIAVGSLGVANAFGLYDMHGNVWEWCADVWHDNYEGAPTDGSVWESGGDTEDRVLRGGSYITDGYRCRSAVRERLYDYLGLRVVVSVALPLL